MTKHDRKGIIPTGGSGIALYLLSNVMSKQWMAVYEKLNSLDSSDCVEYPLDSLHNGQP